ncbi:DUF6414 family protein [Aquirufa ecclesiirivi]|uniref:DUF6414 family protein n=1 Tax=Aquirufa ecclesiirivi TaxID=2715124 RepID=UPI003BAEEBE0
MKSIKDLIYFDLEKARSLISQIKGGLISEISRAFEDEGEFGSELGFDFKLIKGKLSGKEKERNIKTEKIEIYHELLNQIEEELEKKKLLTNINDTFDNFKGSYNDFIKTTQGFSFIKAIGWSQFEDFERLKNIFTNFNEIQRLIFSSQLLESPEVKSMQQQIKDSKKGAENLERNQKAKELNRLKSLEKQFDDKLKELTEIHVFDDDYINRMKMFLDTFSPNRLNFRLLPLDDFNDFQILANLKEKYLVDSNFESIIYTYGTRPNIKLSVLGIITSCPQTTDQRVDPNDEFLIYNDDELNEVQGFDKAFRNVFTSFEAFEKFFFVPSFPKLSISPIAIYREVIYDEEK